MNKISVEEWLEAERELAAINSEARPEGYITPEEYGRMKNPKVSTQHARRLLKDMVNAGLATSAKWKVGRNNLSVFYLKPKKDWPKK